MIHLKFGYYDSEGNTNVWGFITSPSTSLAPAEFPTIHFSSDTTYLVRASNPTG